MRAILLLLLLPACMAANTYGYSRVTIERTWTVSDDGGPFDLRAAIAVNGSGQHVLSLETSPQMEVSTDPDGVIWLHYNGTGANGTVLRASAVVDIDYDTNITSDIPPPGSALAPTPLTTYDHPIMVQAEALEVNGSSLSTIRNLVNWVHSYVAYDISYWGKTRSAEEVFDEKRGVCVEYTHLLISMARSLGFDTRYVSGYVYADAWQPHAWAEISVPGYGWLPADATFGQVGTLDDTHLAMRYAPDQASAYDLFVARDPNATISESDTVTTGFLSSDPKGVVVSLTLDPDTYVADAQVTNTRPDYVFGSYSLQVPDGFGGEQPSVLLLSPYETVHRYQGLNHSLFQDGFYYNVPVSAAFNDAHDHKTLGVSGSSSPLGSPQSAPLCAGAYVLPSLLAAALLRRSAL